MKSMAHCVLQGSIGLLICALTSHAIADPPMRVARLSYFSGIVSFAPASIEEWVDATLNRPLTIGDRLWVDKDSRAELQLENAVARIGNNTNLNILNLDNKITQFQFNQGDLILRIWKIKPNQSYEINTSNLAFTTQHPGNYRVDVDANKKSTTVNIYNGRALVYGENKRMAVYSGQSCTFTGTNLQNHHCSYVRPPDNFDRWGAERDKNTLTAMSSSHVNQCIIGFEDLETEGKWVKNNIYGMLWTPSHVTTDWAPYHDGRWAWVAPWGWTWIDAHTWGFAPFHYGRWVYLENAWYWSPGQINTNTIYSPALVAFITNIKFKAGGNGIGWFALGPTDVYMPAYDVSENYFLNLNSNPALKKNEISHFYHKILTNFEYTNKQKPNSISITSIKDFTQGNRVQKFKLTTKLAWLANKPITLFPRIKPTINSVLGTIKLADKKPPLFDSQRFSLVKTFPAKRPNSFVEQEYLLAMNPGLPLTFAQLNTLKSRYKTTSCHIKMIKLGKVEKNTVTALVKTHHLNTKKSHKLALKTKATKYHQASRNKMKMKNITASNRQISKMRKRECS